MNVVAKIAAEEPDDWDEYLCFAMASYRSSVHATTGETPNRLMLGREVYTPATLLAPPAPDATPKQPWVDQLHQRFRDMYETVMSTTQASHRSAKRYFDRWQKDLKFEVGELVWLYGPKPRRGAPRKLEPNRWLGPFTVKKKLSSCVYLIKKEDDRTGRVVNVDRLAPCVRRDPVRFPQAEKEEGENDDDANEQQSQRQDSTDTEDNEEPRVDEAHESPNYSRLPTRRPQRQRQPPRRLADYVPQFEL